MQSPDGEESFLLCHAFPLVTGGFEGRARIARLASAAVTDLFNETPALRDVDGPIPFYLALPSIGPAEQSEPQTAPNGSDARADSTLYSDARSILSEALSLNRLHAPHELRFASSESGQGFVLALDAALADLRQGRCQHCVVGAVDSLVDEERINEINDLGILKTPDHAVGLQPGEAAAFFLVGSYSAAWSNDPPITIGRIASAREADDDSTGIALSQLLDECAPEEDRAHWVLSDQTGDYLSAMEYGQALVRFAAGPKGSSGKPLVLWSAAELVGDCGLAAPAVSCCVAMQAFRRRYAPARSALVTAVSRSRSRSLIQLWAN